MLNIQYLVKLYLIFLLSQLPNRCNEFDINTNQLAILVNDPADKSSLTVMFWPVDVSKLMGVVLLSIQIRMKRFL